MLGMAAITCRPENFAQTATLDTIEKQYQACLDEGTNMLDCSKTFYQQVDSLLNIQYKKLRTSCDSIQREYLKDEQADWQQQRENYFGRTLAEFKKENPRESPFSTVSGNRDDAMFMFDKNAEFVKARLIVLINSKPENYSPAKYSVNPTGYYLLNNKRRKGKQPGYTGDIKVKTLGNNKVVVRLFVSKGAPSYNSGTLADTLSINNNQAIYKNPELDKSCRIVLNFFRQGIRVTEFTDDFSFGCGFGHGVNASGFFRRQSYEVPTSEDLQDD